MIKRDRTKKKDKLNFEITTTIKKHFHNINITSVLCERCWICNGGIFVNTPTLTTTFLVLPDVVFERFNQWLCLNKKTSLYFTACQWIQQRFLKIRLWIVMFFLFLIYLLGYTTADPSFSTQPSLSSLSLLPCISPADPSFSTQPSLSSLSLLPCISLFLCRKP